MKVAIYSPYLDSASGGERYIMTIAKALINQAEVDILLDSHLQEIGIPAIKEKLQRLEILDLNKCNFIPGPFGAGSNFRDRYSFLKKYDWFFLHTDGSIFYSTAKNSVIHFQMPLPNLSAKGVWGQIKLKSWKCGLFNSQFTKDEIQKSWNINGPVVYPPIDVKNFTPLKKEKIILNVGRFVAADKIKKQHVLVEAFKLLVDKKGVKGWTLHLAGSAREGDMSYVQELEKLSEGYPIKIHPNISFKELTKLNGQASLYWHAMGYQETDPARYEHFGITTVEAMAAGAVPVVINKGGQIEIVQQGESGMLWDTPEELVEESLALINDSKTLQLLSEGAVRRSKDFSEQHFIEAIQGLVK